MKNDTFQTTGVTPGNQNDGYCRSDKNNTIYQNGHKDNDNYCMVTADTAASWPIDFEPKIIRAIARV
jgi:hypothetical protein